MKTTIAICLPVDVLFNVDRYCKEIACSRSSFISQAISLYTNLLPKGHAVPPPARRDLGDLRTRMLDRIDANMGSITKADLSKPFNSTSTAKERDAVIDELVKDGKVRLRQVPRGIGRPVTLVEFVPAEGECDPPAAWWPPPPVDAEERVMRALRGAGRLTLTELRRRAGRHMSRMDMDNAVNAMMTKGLVTLEREPKGANPGRPSTWIVLSPAKAPVEPVAASDAPGGGGVAEAPETPHAGNGGVLEGVAPAGAGEVVR